MNRRQKMKRMKQELEWYKKQMVPTREVGYDSRQIRVETLAIQQKFDPYDALILVGEDRVKDILCEKLGRQLKPYVQFSKYDTDLVRTGHIAYTGILKVVVPER